MNAFSFTQCWEGELDEVVSEQLLNQRLNELIVRSEKVTICVQKAPRDFKVYCKGLLFGSSMLCINAEKPLIKKPHLIFLLLLTFKASSTSHRGWWKIEIENYVDSIYRISKIEFAEKVPENWRCYCYSKI